MMFKEMRTNNTIVNNERTILFNRQHAPDQEDTLQIVCLITLIFLKHFVLIIYKYLPLITSRKE